MTRTGFGRSAFSLVELMVVLVIIGILTALTAAAVGKYIEVSKANATANTIRKVYSRLQSQRAAVMKAALTEDMAKTVGSSVLAQIQAVAGSGASPTLSDWQLRTRIIYVKLRLKQEFPMTFAEALSPTPLPAKPAYAQALTGLASGQPYESSACLLLALRQGRGGSSVSGDDYGSTSVKSFTDPSNSALSVQALVDGWGTPMAYYRWPWGNWEVDSLVASPQTFETGQTSGNPSVVHDSEDPNGLLLNTSWYNSTTTYPSSTNTIRQQFEAWCHSMTNTGQPAGNPQAPLYAYFTVPAVVSAGPNLQLGLTDQSNTTVPPGGSTGPMAADGTGKDTDNIYSFRLLPPGARGD